MQLKIISYVNRKLFLNSPKYFFPVSWAWWNLAGLGVVKGCQHGG